MLHPLQALFDSFGHNNVLVSGRVEQGPVTLNDGDLIEVKQRCLCNMNYGLIAASACFLPPVCQHLLPWLALQVLRKHHGPRQFVYYSKSSGQTSAARKSLQQEQWPLKGPGPSEASLLASKAPQTSPMPPALPGQPTQTCVQPTPPAPQQQQFAMPPAAPPCPPAPWLSGLTQHQVANSRSQGKQSAQLHLQHEGWSEPGPAKAPAGLPPVPPPLPPLPWVRTSQGAATKEQQASPQQQQQSLKKQAQTHLAAALPAPPLPPFPVAKHVTISSAPATTLPQQPSWPSSSAQFAPPPVPPPPPPQPKQSKGSINARLSCGRSEDVGVQQLQEQQPNSGDGGNVQVKGSKTVSDVHRLVAQQAAAAALTRHRHLNMPEHSDQLPQAAAATPADSKSDELVHTCTPTCAMQASQP